MAEQAAPAAGPCKNPQLLPAWAQAHGHLALKPCDNIAAEPTAAKPAAETTPATAWLWPGRSSKVEKLGRRGSKDPDQQRDRQQDQRAAAVDENPEKEDWALACDGEPVGTAYNAELAKTIP